MQQINEMLSVMMISPGGKLVALLWLWLTMVAAAVLIFRGLSWLYRRLRNRRKVEQQPDLPVYLDARSEPHYRIRLENQPTILERDFQRQLQRKRELIADSNQYPANADYPCGDCKTPEFNQTRSQMPTTGGLWLDDKSGFRQE